jgi:non-lysosomal glucosylceramidase
MRRVTGQLDVTQMNNPLRNDPFAMSPAALNRASNFDLPRSRGKWDILFQPMAATGVPLGGIGTGGITRCSDGRFSRWTIKGGGVRQMDLPANGFLLRVKPESAGPRCRALQPEPSCSALSAFDYESQTPQWNGLFPLARHQHQPLCGITAECKSYSPLIAGDLASSALPVAMFRWRLTNNTDIAAETSLIFHFANMNGMFGDFGEAMPERIAAGCHNRPTDIPGGTGVVMDRRRVGPEPKEGDGEWAITAAGNDAIQFGRTICFDGMGDGQEFWDAIVATGDAPDLGPGWMTESGFREVSPGLPTAAVSARLKLAPGESRELIFSLAWDLPVITFGQGRKWYRAYTDDWGRSGTAAASISNHALESAAYWEQQIDAWHNRVEQQLGAKPHRAGMAINELYFLVDGLTVYTSAHGSPDGRRHFGLIECHDYALYNTLDLWIYAAEAIGKFSPELSASVAEDFADHVTVEDPVLRRHRWDTTLFPLNVAGACPHDLGGPGEDPFVVPNSYTYRDSTLWKDLNCDLVLCIWREGQRMGSPWRQKLFPKVAAAINHLQRFDRDGDGLIENDGIPDQTFDNIPMTGPSSYCGGLWIAALKAGAQMAAEAGKPDLAAAWSRQAERATTAFNDLLFNGTWFRVDTSGPLSEACFVEQLLGPFLSRRFGLGDIVDAEKARSALIAIHENNFLDEGRGEGAVSLSRIPAGARDGLPHRDDTSFQTVEIQPGFNLSFAAQLEEWDLRDRAETLREALFTELYVKRNLVFQTPAAIDVSTDTCRAIMNMRPLSVWWMT